MNLPIHDHMVHRAHGIYDSLSVRHHRVHLLDKHLRRLEHSASVARIPFPFPTDSLVQKILDLLAFAYTKATKEDLLNLRFYLSSGDGDFGILPKESVLYAVVVKGHPYKGTKLYDGVSELIIKDVPVKPPILATIKSTNYLLNALTAVFAKERGGYLGINVDNNGFLTEASLANVGLVNHRKEFLTPKLDNALQGTTLVRCLEHMEKTLLKEGKLAKIEFKDITPEEAYESSAEFMLFGGDKIVPVLTLDGHRIGNGKKGLVTQALQDFIENDLFDGEEIPVQKYAK
eukprot:TRINITY_DN8165_c0_g1_i6.p1 TRINITY_DN8165_c0_g1~~TRINITY_DN8165_c0_g1_i6.p1  ORF type:complete len:288 (-),score=64.12 TRINITY_DN8165_c0_g1_i6:180-1043(-)